MGGREGEEGEGEVGGEAEAWREGKEGQGKEGINLSHGRLKTLAALELATVDILHTFKQFENQSYSKTCEKCFLNKNILFHRLKIFVGLGSPGGPGPMCTTLLNKIAVVLQGNSSSKLQFDLSHVNFDRYRVCRQFVMFDTSSGSGNFIWLHLWAKLKDVIRSRRGLDI